VLVKYIQWAIDNPDGVSALGDKAQARARAVYSWDAVTSQYEKLFEDMKLSR